MHPIRQTGPHAHQILFDPLNGDVFVPDLGLDTVLVYRLDEVGKLTERLDARITVAPGAGPRHLAFHRDLVHLFLLNELDSTLVVLRREGGRFIHTHTTSTLPAGVTDHNQTSAVRVSTTGRSVLVSNRGYDSIAVFRFDPRKHAVELRTVEPTRGKEPRDFVQSPDGGAIVVGNQDSDTIVTFEFDEEAAQLTFSGQVDAPTPVCLRFVS
ncbi:hypothetical protein ASE16_02200 [Leifsonia sp. Root227]|nr:hypothetical protein ASE16_02200 [Leifsonia sp. Root227]